MVSGTRPVIDRVDPVIIQGGMGIGVSAWPLARAVALTGQLGSEVIECLLAESLESRESKVQSSGSRVAL